MSVVKDIGEDSGHDGNGTRPKEPTKEATYDDCLQVLGGSDGELEDSEAKHANEEWQSSTLQFRQRGEKSWSASKSKNIQGHSQRAYFG